MKNANGINLTYEYISLFTPGLRPYKNVRKNVFIVYYIDMRKQNISKNTGIVCNSARS